MDIRVVWGRPAEDSDSDQPMANLSHWRARPFTAPDVGLTVMPGARVYPGNIQTRDATEHTGGQLLLDHDFQIVPASYSAMDGRPTLPSDVDVHTPAETLAGDYLFLGSIHPHFGHVMLEGLARVWACDEFISAHPQGRLIVYEPQVPEFALTLLALAGVDPARLLCLSGPVVVERLHVPDIAYRSHRWISPRQVATWRGIGDRVAEGARSERVYLSRRGAPSRVLVQEAEIETLFADAGFRIVRPETLTMTDQIRLARQADVIAGCVGSQMYLAAFQPAGGRTLVMAPSNFFLADDALIASGMEHRLAVAFGGPRDRHAPQASWSIDPAAAHALIADLDA